MDMQNVSNLQIPEGEVRTIHDKNNRLLWGRVAYDTKYAGDTIQNGAPTPDAPIPVQTVTGAQTITIGDGASSQTYEINLGKNLFDVNGTSNAFRANKTISGQTITSTATATGTGYVAIAIPNSNNLLGKECSISFSAQASVGNARFRIADGASSNPSSIGSVIKTIVGNGSKTETVTFPTSYGTGKDCFVVLLYPHTDDFTWDVGDYATFANIQLEIGSATSYAPYFTPIELCKIGSYQDYIYKSGDDWYVHKETKSFNLVDTTSWGRDANGRFYSTGWATNNGFEVAPGLCTHLIYSITPWYGDGYFGITSSGNLWVATGNAAITSGAEMNAWLATKLPVVYGVLEHTTDTQITDDTLIGQLNAINEWLTRYGYEPTVSGNLPIIIDRTNL